MTTRRVSYEQLESIWEFLNAHRDIALGFNKSAQARAMSRRMWTELAENLNSFVGGATKDWKNWSNYWIDYKGKLKRKCASLRASHTHTGGGPSRVPDLTEMELKYLSILGEDLGSGLPGIQVAVESIATEATTTESPTLFNTDFEILDIINAEPQQPTTIQDTQPPHPPRPQTPVQPPRPQTPVQSRRRRRLPVPMSQEAARRALVDSSRVRAEATVECSNTLKNILNILSNIATTLDRISSQ